MFGALNASRFVLVGSLSIISTPSHSSICSIISNSGLALFDIFEYALAMSAGSRFSS